jgi:hypothetical protein
VAGVSQTATAIITIDALPDRVIGFVPLRPWVALLVLLIELAFTWISGSVYFVLLAFDFLVSVNLFCSSSLQIIPAW